MPFRPFARFAAVLALAIPLLSACGGDADSPAVVAAPGAGLETVVVAAREGEGERLFDGTVEANALGTPIAWGGRWATSRWRRCASWRRA